MSVGVTERAEKELKTMLITADAEPDQGLRLLPVPDGRYMLALDTELSGDQVVEYEGAKALLVAPELASVVEGVTLDVQDTPEGSKLVISKD